MVEGEIRGVEWIDREMFVFLNVLFIVGVVK